MAALLVQAGAQLCSGEGGDLVSMQLTSHWGAKKGEISGLHEHLLLSFGLIGPLHSSGALHYECEIKW